MLKKLYKPTDFNPNKPNIFCADSHPWILYILEACINYWQKCTHMTPNDLDLEMTLKIVKNENIFLKTYFLTF